MYIIQMPNVVVGTGVRLNVQYFERCPNILSLCTNKEDKNVTHKVWVCKVRRTSLQSCVACTHTTEQA